jgi:hypothetical protein
MNSITRSNPLVSKFDDALVVCVLKNSDAWVLAIRKGLVTPRAQLRGDGDSEKVPIVVRDRPMLLLPLENLNLLETQPWLLCLPAGTIPPSSNPSRPILHRVEEFVGD